jgi:1-acyl-sn-glycerol-3-phosphate acyltransferase
MLLSRLGIAKLWGNDPERGWFVGRSLVPIPMWLLAPGYSYGRERIPATGGGVVVANHFSGIDPPFIGIHSTRTIYFMAKAELLAKPIIGDLLRWVGVFGVRRGEGDRDSIRVARWLAREGHLVGMFMEGTRQKVDHPGAAHPGAAMIAIQENVPIIPCAIDTFGWSLGKRRRHAIVWGEPFMLEGFAANGRGYKEAAAVLEEAVVGLWRQATEAAADGFPETLSDGARRHSRLRVRRVNWLRGLRPWPTESWASGPLGPVYREER